MISTKSKDLLRISAFTLTIYLGFVLCCCQDVFAETELTSLDQYPSVKTIDFAADPVRENVPESSMMNVNSSPSIASRLSSMLQPQLLTWRVMVFTIPGLSAPSAVITR